MATIEIKIPDIGDFKDVEVIELLVKPGDLVKAEQSLVTVESDKASMEIPAPQSGRVVSLKVKLGDKVNQGSLLAEIEALEPSQGAVSPTAVTTSPESAGAAAVLATPVASAPVTIAAPAPAPAPTSTSTALPEVPTASAPRPASLPGTDTDEGGHVVKPHASPSVRKFARELGVDLALVRGTGPKLRITPEDVRAYVKGAIAQSGSPSRTPAGTSGAGLGLIPWPEVDFAKFGPTESRPLSRIRKLAAANLHRNWVMIPHVTNHDEADVTALEAFRVELNDEHGKAGPKLTMLAFLIKACVHALKQFPEFNASLQGDSLVLKQYWHIGFAADTPNGLVVPVIRDADRKGLGELATETAELARVAREGKLSPTQMQGGTFSISSLGGIGGTGFTPIINAPEVAILGVSRTVMRPVWSGTAFEPRLMLPLSLSYDHRVIDGAVAARFNAHLARLLADFRRVLL
jgi:pyruvate dehydrogenase E2 component (dihydrolipoamide acetyltransferase)